MVWSLNCPNAAWTGTRWPPSQAYQIWCPHAAQHVRVGAHVTQASSIAAPALEPQGLPNGRSQLSDDTAVAGTRAPAIVLAPEELAGKASLQPSSNGVGCISQHPRHGHRVASNPAASPRSLPQHQFGGTPEPSQRPHGPHPTGPPALLCSSGARNRVTSSYPSQPSVLVSSRDDPSSTSEVSNDRRTLSNNATVCSRHPSLSPSPSSSRNSHGSTSARSSSSSNSSSSTSNSITNNSSSNYLFRLRPSKKPKSSPHPPTTTTTTSPTPSPASSLASARHGSRPPSPPPPLSLDLLQSRTPALRKLDPSVLRHRLAALAALLRVDESEALKLCDAVKNLLVVEPYELRSSMQRLRYALHLAPPPATKELAITAPAGGAAGVKVAVGAAAAAVGSTVGTEAAGQATAPTTEAAARGAKRVVGSATAGPAAAALPAGRVATSAGVAAAKATGATGAAGATSPGAAAARAAAAEAKTRPARAAAAAAATAASKEGKGLPVDNENADHALQRVCVQAPLLLVMPPGRVQESIAVLSTATALPPRRAAALLRRQPQLATYAPATLAAKLEALKRILMISGAGGGSSAAAAAATLTSAMHRAPSLLTFSSAALQHHCEQLFELLGPHRLAVVLRREPEVLTLKPASLAAKLRLLQQLLDCCQHPAAIALLVVREPGILQRSLRALSRGCRALSIWALPRRVKLRMLISRPGLLLLPPEEVYGRCRWLRRLVLSNQYYHRALRRVPPSVLGAIVAALPGAWARLLYLVESNQEGAVRLMEAVEGGQAAFEQRFPAFERWLRYKIKQMGAESPWRGAHRIRGIGTPAPDKNGRANLRNLAHMRQQASQATAALSCAHRPTGPTVPVVLAEACQVRSGGSTVSRPRRVVQQPLAAAAAADAPAAAPEPVHSNQQPGAAATADTSRPPLTDARLSGRRGASGAAPAAPGSPSYREGSAAAVAAATGRRRPGSKSAAAAAGNAAAEADVAAAVLAAVAVPVGTPAAAAAAAAAEAGGR